MGRRLLYITSAKPMADNMYSAEEAAQILGLQVRTVRNYVRDGRLPGVRIGKQYRIARADLEAFTAGGFTQRALLGLDRLPERRRPARPVAEVSSVVQIDGIDEASRDRIERTLAAALLADAAGGRPLRVGAALRRGAPAPQADHRRQRRRDRRAAADRRRSHARAQVGRGRPRIGQPARLARRGARKRISAGFTASAIARVVGGAGVRGAPQAAQQVGSRRVPRVVVVSARGDRARRARQPDRRVRPRRSRG